MCGMAEMEEEFHLFFKLLRKAFVCYLFEFIIYHKGMQTLPSLRFGRQRVFDIR
jgi:hypothetical protein